MNKTKTLSIRVSEEDKNIINHYAKFHDISPSELIKSSVLEKIEDEIDLKLYRESMEAYEKDSTTYTIDEVESILGF